MKQVFKLIECQQMFTNTLAFNLTTVENKCIDMSNVEWINLLPTKPKLRTYVTFTENICADSR